MRNRFMLALALLLASLLGLFAVSEASASVFLGAPKGSVFLGAPSGSVFLGAPSGSVFLGSVFLG